MESPTPKNKKSSPLFIYLSLFLVAIAVLLYHFGTNYATQKAPGVTATPSLPVVERAMVELATPPMTATNQQSSTSPLPVVDEGIIAEHQRQVRLFFITASDDGRFNLKGSLTQIGYEGQQELTATINALIGGPGRVDQNKGSYSMIPEGTKLLSASVKNGTAYLNFNENFRFNSFGLDGYNAQLDQIVYTATEFPTVKRVQILIEGQELDYLSEGINIKEPLARK